MFRTILVPVDGSGHANNAVRCASDLAKTYGGTLVVLAVDGCRPLTKPLIKIAETEDLSRGQIFESIAASAAELADLPDGSQVVQRVRSGDPADEILAEAERAGANLIVIGSRGLGEYAELLLGSVSRKVLHLAKVPVMVVRA